MGLAFFNQQRIQEKLRKASIGAIETNSQAEEVLLSDMAENVGEGISSVPLEADSTTDRETITEETKSEEIKVKSKPQTKKAKQAKQQK